MTNPVVTFFEKIGSFFVSMFKKAPSLAQKISAVVTYVAPIAESILELADPPAAAIAGPIIQVVESDLATVKTVVSGATVTAGSTTAQTVEAALSSIKTNISGLLQMAEVKNSAKIQEITAATDAITGEIDAMLGSLAAAA